MHPGAMNRSRRLDNYSGWQTAPRNLQWGTPSLLEDFEVFGDWSISGGAGGPPTIADDAINYKVGTHSLHYQANGATGNVDVYKTCSFTLASAGTFLEMWVKNNAAVNTDIALFLSATWPTKLIQYNLPQIGDQTGDWILLRWRKDSHTAPTGGFTYTDTITRMTFRFNGSSIDVNMDGLYLNSDAQPAVLFTFDDCPDKTATNGPMALEKHNIKASAGHVGNYINQSGYMTANQLSYLASIGWIVCNHSETHPHFNTMTQAQIETELSNCVGDFNTAGVVGHMADIYAWYPYGEYDADVEAAMAAQGFRWGRSIRTTGTNQIQNMETFNHRVFNVHSKQPLLTSTFLSSFNSTIQQGGLYILYNHGVDRDVLSGSDITVSMLAGWGGWCARGRAVVLTADDLWQLRSGPIRVRRPKRRMTVW